MSSQRRISFAGKNCIERVHKIADEYGETWNLAINEKAKILNAGITKQSEGSTTGIALVVMQFKENSRNVMDTQARLDSEEESIHLCLHSQS